MFGESRIWKLWNYLSPPKSNMCIQQDLTYKNKGMEITITGFV